MAFDCNSNHRKPLLFSDLFKNHKSAAMEKLEHQDHVLASGSSSNSNSSSSSTYFLSSWDSSSSGFSSPPYSDLGSSEADDADFIAELTRQVAECMLQEEETAVAEESSAGDGYENSKSGFYSIPQDPTPPNIQVYEVKNQPPVSREGLNRGRRVMGTESAQQKQMQKAEQQYRGGREWGGVGRNGYSGSGMKAVFLGGSGPRTGSGTGVFLPRDPTELKQKSGCAMVLMPTRVLEVLEQHFSKIQQDSNAPPPPLSGGSTKDKDESTLPDGVQDGSPEFEDPEIRPADDDEMQVQLPQEWTY